MTILVTGANGQLGNEMRIVAGESGDNYVFTDMTQQEGAETEYLDITDIEAVRRIVKEKKVEAIVNCAAYTNVDAAESNFELAEKLNALAPENLAKAMEEVGGLLVQISTDYVFGKEPYNVPCREDQKGTPTGVYGLTKLHGEEKIEATGCSHVIIRTAWLYSEYGKNFCKTMMNLTATRERVSVVFDQAGTPTYALDLAHAIAAVLKDYTEERGGEGAAASGRYSKTGIYHYSNEGVCSWFDFARMTAEFAGNTDCEVLPCHSDEFPSPVRRPSYSVLDKTKIKET
ncbi:MAG: dTDP-4-dehydrorhamnose reductase, partial [Candidatus Cryptobacteroides sp.]